MDLSDQFLVPDYANNGSANSEDESGILSMKSENGTTHGLS